jgi:glycosyltransferase domain-containing protein
MTMTARISIIVPTMNRVEFVNRTLHYYAGRGFDGVLLFADSSTSPHREIMADVVAGFRDRLKIDYAHLPAERYPGVAECIAAMLERIETPYVVLTPDDDLQVVGTLRAAADFLDDNPEFSAAMGHRFNLSLGDVVPWGAVRHAGLVPYPSLDGPRAFDRVFNYASQAVAPLYAVMRTPVFRRAYAGVRTGDLPYFGEEFLPSTVLLGLGRLHQLTRVGPVPQVDGSGGIWVRNTPFSLIADLRWPENCDKLCQTLADAFAQAEAVPLAKARRRAEVVVWHHLRLLLTYHFERFASPDRPPAPPGDNLLDRMMGNGDFRDIVTFLASPRPMLVNPRPWTGDSPCDAPVRAALDAGDAAGALALAGELWRRAPGAPASALAAGDAARRAQRRHDAIAWYRLALAGRPDWRPALLGLGWVLVEQGRTVEAAQVVEQARDPGPPAQGPAQGEELEQLALACSPAA